jgi:hypothetical protein
MNNVTHFFLRDDDTRRFITCQLNRAAEIKDIEKLEEREYFFNWKAVDEVPLIRG